MLYEDACRILDIPPDSSRDTLRQAYRREVLKYHPDKNKSPEAADKFLQVNEAYIVVSKYNGDTDEESDADEDDVCPDTTTDTSERSTTYAAAFASYVRSLFAPDENRKLYSLILSKLAGMCETAALEYLRRIDRKTVEKIYRVLEDTKSVFTFSETFLRQLGEYVSSPSPEIIVNPLLDDLLEDKVYMLQWNGETLVVPLWHNEMVFDVSGREVTVHCCPVLPDNIALEEDNTLVVRVNACVRDVLTEGGIKVKVGKKELFLRGSGLRCVPDQTVTVSGQGVPAMNVSEICDVSVRQDILVTVCLF